MSRQVFILSTEIARTNCLREIVDAPEGARVEIKGPKRTIDQNSHLWALLTDVSRQLEHGGRKYEPDEWKFIWLQAFGKETRFLPALDGKSFVPIPQSSSDLSRGEMASLLDFIYAEGSQRGVVFSEPPAKSLPWRREDESAA